MSIDDKLFTVKYKPDEVSHLKPDNEKCKKCKTKICTTICPAKVYEWNEKEKNLTVNFCRTNCCANFCFAFFTFFIVWFKM